MNASLEDLCRQEFVGLDATDPQYAVDVVDRVLGLGRRMGASDVHLQPEASGMALWLRIDGVLHQATQFPKVMAPNIVARLKVLAELLTYRIDVPQEGRIRDPSDDIEMRVSTFPTLYGERAVVRFFSGARQYQYLDDLGLPADVLDPLRQLTVETSGAVLVTGPAGSGKTTTAYAAMREILRHNAGRRSLMSIEDPIEVAVPGVAQAQVNPNAGLDLATGLRFLLRQDPEVILVGEIRDRATAEAALQASLTGHLLLSTFHAGSAAEAVGRLSDMGIEPYLLQSGLLAILCQRLVRRLCDCARETSDPAARLGLPVETVREPVGCERCGGTGYRGRLALAELLLPRGGPLRAAVLTRSDAATLNRLALESGMIGRWQRACDAVRAGRTSPAEVRRTLGFSEPPLADLQ